MNPEIIIENISIKNFRNHNQFKIENNNPIVVINGNNGSGKTNTLEAISIFSPGKGLRGANLDEMLNNNSQTRSFEISIDLRFKNGSIKLSKKYDTENKSENFYKINNEKIKTVELLNYLNILWITPIMEKVMLQNNTEKRNFIDRLIFNLHKDHLNTYTKLQKCIRERLILLKNQSYDENWITNIEKNISELSANVGLNRKKYINLINQTLIDFLDPMSLCQIDLKYKNNLFNQDVEKKEVIKLYRIELKKNRELDLKSNRLNMGINSLKIDILRGKENPIDAKHCSSGEQKSMLISIIISVAKLIKKMRNGGNIVLLIDEAMAHLDDYHKEKLYNEIRDLNCHVWLTGVSKDLFWGFRDQTVFIDVKNTI